MVDHSRPSTSRGQEIAEDVPAGLGGLGTVVRVRRTGAFAPAGRAAGDDADQDVVEVLLAAGAGLERPDQRKANDSELDLLDPHGRLGPRCTWEASDSTLAQPHRCSRAKHLDFDISRRRLQDIEPAGRSLAGACERDDLGTFGQS